MYGKSSWLLGASVHGLACPEGGKNPKVFLAAIGMDITNAYGSIPHKFIVYALCRYGIYPQWIRLVENYYKGICSKSFSESATSAWHRHQQGIFASCTLSIILFLAGMNITLEYSLQVKVPKFTTNNTKLPLLRAFIDVLSLTSFTVSKAQTLLSQCTTALTWAGLAYKSSELRNLPVELLSRVGPSTQHLFLFQKQQINQNLHLTFLSTILDHLNFWVA